VESWAWHRKRRELQEKELQERRDDIGRARIPLQAAITEQAIRELYDKVAVLEAKTPEPKPIPEPVGKK
jgi:hypothetical protein